MSVKSIPLIDAYAFGNAKKLTSEINKIKNMEITTWDKPYTSTVRRGYILNLFNEKGILPEFIKKYWPDGDGATKPGLLKQNFYTKVVKDYENYIENIKPDTGNNPPPHDDNENPSGESDSEFLAESDLRNVLAANLSCIESGLRLYQKGIEYSIDKGRIDILAIDKNDNFVVIELKLSRGRNNAIGQLLYYMGWVDENLSKPKCLCRGIIVAKEITPELVLSTHRTYGISLFKYNLKISVEAVQLNEFDDKFSP